MIDLIIRTKTQAVWQAIAQARHIISADPDNPGQFIVAPDFAVDEIGNVALTTGVIDTWWTVNLRIFSDAALADQAPLDLTVPADPNGTVYQFARSRIAAALRNGATVVTTPQGWTAYQNATGTAQVVDPRTVTTPPRVWYGAMSF
jgi:hypothetical protein